jgi:hypothetical protein
MRILTRPKPTIYAEYEIVDSPDSSNSSTISAEYEIVDSPGLTPSPRLSNEVTNPLRKHQLPSPRARKKTVKQRIAPPRRKFTPRTKKTNPRQIIL